MRTYILFVVLALATCVYTQAPQVREDPKYLCLQKIADATKTSSMLSVSGIEDVNTLVLFIAGLSTETQQKISACELNLAPAFKRCENVHGKNNCVKITDTFVNRKCPKNYENAGCCQCVVSCPAKWENRGYWCMKPETTSLTQYAKESLCTVGGNKCEQFGNKFWVRECPEMHQRIAGKLCVPVCPLGWNDQGNRCQKPNNMHIGHPFIWTHGDK